MIIDPLPLAQYRAVVWGWFVLTSGTLSNKEPTVSFGNPSVADHGERQHV